MSLHKFAEQVAANGRGDDSLLVHMTPDEVRKLQQFAEANGTTLTINPTTGLPEAGFLSDLFKAVAPIALGAFLGPGAFGIAGLGLSAGTAGLVTGGLTTLATGSLSRGLMAGLGAYGGAGLAGSLMDAGSASLASSAGATAGAEATQQGLSEALRARAIDDAAISQGFNEAVGKTTASDVFSAGTKSAMADPMAFAKNNLRNIGMAAAPLLAMQPTTKMPEPKDTGYIRQFAYNINPDTGKPDPLYGMRAMTPVKASEFGTKTLQGQRDLFYQQNPNPYDIGVASLNQPPQQQPAQMAGGGIVALAKGGVAHFVDGGYVPGQFDQATINAALATELKNNSGASLEGLRNVARDTYKLTDAEINRAFDTIPGFNAQGQFDEADYGATSGSGIKNTQAQVDAAKIYRDAEYAKNINFLKNNSIQHSVLDEATGKRVQLNQYHPDFDPTNPITLAALGQKVLGGDTGASSFFLSNPTYRPLADAAWAKERDRLNALDIAAGRIPDPNAKKPTGLENLNKNQNLLTNQDQNKNLTNANTGLAALDAGKSKTYKWFEERGLGFTPIDKVIDNWFDEYTDDLARLPPEKQVAEMKDALNVSGMNEADLVKATGKTINDWIQIKTGNINKVTSTYLPGGVSGGGETVLNANGTVTTKPDFSLTMNEVRNAYTDGGGSLGYTSPVVKTPAEHEAAYNKLTDDSLDAYNYLMGKGKNLTQRKAETRNRPVMQRYDEAVLGRKAAKLTKPGATTTDKVTTVVGVPGQPQTYFDEAAYLAANPDVAAELKTGKSVSGQPTQFTSGYQHYLMYGKAGGRPFTGDYQGYTTALALANSAGAGGGGGGGNTTSATTGAIGFSNNEANSITGLSQAPNPNISVVSMDTMSPDAAAAAAATAADSAAASAASATGDAPGSDGSPGSGAKRGGLMRYAMGGGLGSLGSYSDGGRLLRGPGDGVSDSIPATIGRKNQPARLADGEFVIPARIVSELGNGSTDAGAKKLYAMMDRVQRARGKTTGKNKVAANSRSDKYLPA